MRTHNPKRRSAELAGWRSKTKEGHYHGHDANNGCGERDGRVCEPLVRQKDKCLPQAPRQEVIL